MVIHFDSAKEDVDFEKLYGPNEAILDNKNCLLNNALRNLRNFPEEPELVILNSQIVNKCFPSDYAKTAKKIAKLMKFQPDLDFLLKEHGQSSD